MTEPEKGSAKSFRYNAALEHNIGKRTGNYIRRSGIGKDWDGLENLNDYFETNTDRLSVANTDDLESSLISDVLVEDSDTEKRSSLDGSARSKMAKKKDQRKKKMLQLSGQKSFGLFEDLMEPSQSQTTHMVTRSSRKSNFDDSLGIKGFSSKIKNRGRTKEDSSKEVSPDELRDNYQGNDMTMMTHLTKTPEISKSYIYEEDSAQTAQKELNSLIKQHNEQFSEYMHKLQEDKNLKTMRTQLKQIQDSRSQEFSLFQSPGALSGILPSPQTRDMNFTTFSILDSTNKKQKENSKDVNRDKELKGFRQPDLRESPQPQPQPARKGKENEEGEPKQGKKAKEEKDQKEKTKKNEDKKQGKKGKEEETKANTEANKKDTKNASSRLSEESVKENKAETKKTKKEASPKIEESNLEKARNSRRSEESAPSSLNIKPLARTKEETKTRTSRSFVEEEVYQREGTDHYEYKDSFHYEDNYQDAGIYDQGVEDHYSRASSERNSSEKKEKKVVQNKKGKNKEKNTKIEEEDVEHKTKRVKKNQTKEPTDKVKIPKMEVTKKKEPEEKKKMKIEAAKNTKKRKRDKFLEAYDKAIGPNDLHLVQKPIEKTRETFANGRYPKRHRVGMSCFWKNERSIYMNTGDGIEIVGIMREELSPEDIPKRSKSKGQIKKLGKASKKQEKSPQNLKGKNTDIDEESEQELEALDKMELDYKVISEDAHAITVFLKLKPKQIKEAQTNIAGVMQCSVIKCEDRKAEVFCGHKQYVLSLNDKFVIPEKGIYSIHNKSKTKDLEISCNILKGK